MRTVKEAVAEIKAIDEHTAITEYHVRRLALDGVLPRVRAGKKMLINLDLLIEYLENANDALFTITHRKTRICTVSEKTRRLFDSEKELQDILYENGYVLFEANVSADTSKDAYSIHTQLSDGIVNAFPENQPGLVKIIIPCSEKSRNVASNLSAFINKYPNFAAVPANETMA